MWFFLFFAPLFLSCTQLPPPVLSSASGTPSPLGGLVSDRDPWIKPGAGTRLLLEPGAGGSLKLVLQGIDAGKIHRLMSVRPRNEEGRKVKQGRHFLCSMDGGPSFCEFPIRIPSGEIETSIREGEAVERGAPEDSQTALDTPYIAVADPAWGRRARLKIALGFADRIFDALTGAEERILPAQGDFDEWIWRRGAQVDCSRRKRSGAEKSETACHLHLDLSEGSVDPADPDPHD